MYGVDADFDGTCYADYDPWEHAKQLGIPIVYRTDLPSRDMVAGYSEEHRAIFVRPNLHRAVERCAIAHEIVHYEFADTGHSRKQENRADRIASLRLIRLSTFHQVVQQCGDIGQTALELEVTERIMRVFLKTQSMRARD